MPNAIIFPRALEIAAKTLPDRPAVIGEIVIALVTGKQPGRRLNDVQAYILAACKEEIAEREERRTLQRKAWTERKAKSRANKKDRRNDKHQINA